MKNKNASFIVVLTSTKGPTESKANPEDTGAAFSYHRDKEN